MTVRLTYGLELEWADVDRTITLPCGEWCNEDYTIVNSDGHANCPTGKTWRYGGEINTTPTDTIAGQVEQVKTLAALLNPTINYRCNLHVHVGFDPLTIDLAHTLLAFIIRWQDKVYPLIEPIPIPTRSAYPDPEAFAGAMKRYKRRHKSHQHRLPKQRAEEALASTDLLGFYHAHAPLSAKGERVWHLAARPGMNTRSLHKHGTMEFRHFPGTADPTEVSEALRWCDAFVRCALDDKDPTAMFYEQGPWRFPKFKPYNHDLEVGYQRTKHA